MTESKHLPAPTPHLPQGLHPMAPRRYIRTRMFQKEWVSLQTSGGIGKSSWLSTVTKRVAVVGVSTSTGCNGGCIIIWSLVWRIKHTSSTDSSIATLVSAICAGQNRGMQIFSEFTKDTILTRDQGMFWIGVTVLPSLLWYWPNQLEYRAAGTCTMYSYTYRFSWRTEALGDDAIWEIPGFGFQQSCSQRWEHPHCSR